MFCHRCGTQNPDDAEFCIKCGAKLITEDSQQAVPAPVTPQQSQATPASQQPIQSAPPQQPVPPVTQGAVPVAPAIPPKKKSKKKFIILGSVLLVVIIGIFIAVNWEGETDYIATVKAHMPFDKSQGLPYTYEEVLGKYLSNAVWMTEKNESGADVVVDGIGTGTDTPIQITIGVKPAPNQPDIALITPKSIKAGDSEASTEGETTDILYVFFAAYSEDVKDFAAIRDGIEKANRKFELTETYTNEKEGISFRYPSELEYNEAGEYGVEDEDGASMVAIFGNYTASAMGDPSYSLTILKMTDPEKKDKIFASDSEFFDAFGFNIETITDKSTAQDEINGIKVRLAQSRIDLDAGRATIQQAFFYESGASVYRVILSCSEEDLDVFADLFNQIMDSYTITEPEPTPTPVPTPSPTPEPTPMPGASSSTSLDITFRNKSLVDWCTGPADIAYDTFGWPDYGTVISGSLYSDGSVFFGYNDGVKFLVDPQSGMITRVIVVNADMIYVNGTQFSSDLDEAVSILGTPDDEEYS